MPGWLDVAAKARKLMESSPGGVGLLSYRSDIASDLGVSKGTLHNYVAALKFIEEVRRSSPETAAALQNFSASAVAAYERWWRRDATQVRRHIEKAAKEGWSSRKIISDEAEAREAVRPRSLTEVVLDQLKVSHGIAAGAMMGEAFRRAGVAAPNTMSLTVVKNPTGLSEALGVSQLLAEIAGESEPTNSLQIAVFEVGVGESGRAHKRDPRGLLARATLAASVHTLSLILLQDVLAVSEFGKALPAFRDFQIDGSSPSLIGFELVPGSVVVVINADEFINSWTGVGASMWKQL